MPKSSHLPRFPGGKKILYCAICSVPPEYCQYMDTPAECEEWLQNKHPDVYDELKQRTQKLEDERTAQIAAMEAEKEEEAMAAAMEAEMAEGDDADEAAMLAAMEAEMAGEGEGGGEGEGEGGGAAAAGNTEGAKSADEGADEDDEGAKEKKKKRKTRRGGANNRRQTGKSAGPSVQEIVLSRVQRNKRKYVTIVQGLDTFGHKMKTAAKKLGKRFACGAAVSKGDTGKDEIVIQGDCLADLPKLLSEKYDVPIASMYVMAKGRKVLLNDLRVS